MSVSRRNGAPTKLIRLTLLFFIMALLASACAEDERRALRLTSTSTTVDTGVRILADNCPGPGAVRLSVREDVLWEIEALAVDPDAVPEIAGSVPPPEPTALIEFIVGQTPEDWVETVPLTVSLEPGIRYTVATSPDGQRVDFATPDLQPGLLWDGVGVIQFNPDLINQDCSDPADLGLFAQNIVALVALGGVAAALVLVALITLLFVITRRFSRLRSIEKKAERASQSDAGELAPKR